MLNLIHLFWCNLFVSSVLTLSALFILALVLSDWSAKRQNRELLELCARAREQYQRARRQAEPEAEFNATPATLSEKRRATRLLKIFRWKFVLFVIASMAAVTLVAKNGMSDRSARSQMSRNTTDETGVFDATNVMAGPAATNPRTEDSPALSDQTLAFDYDHTGLQEEQKTVHFSNPASASEISLEPKRTDLTNPKPVLEINAGYLGSKPTPIFTGQKR